MKSLSLDRTINRKLFCSSIFFFSAFGTAFYYGLEQISVLKGHTTASSVYLYVFGIGFTTLGIFAASNYYQEIAKLRGHDFSHLRTQKRPLTNLVLALSFANKLSSWPAPAERQNSCRVSSTRLFIDGDTAGTGVLNGLNGRAKRDDVIWKANFDYFQLPVDTDNLCSDRVKRLLAAERPTQ